MADTPKHSVSVAGIVVDEHDRVLVIQRRDNGHWEPPGGILELDETPEEGAEREVLEETGLSVRARNLTGVYKNMTLGVISLVFRCDLLSGERSSSSETKAVEWKGLAEVRALMSDAYAVRVEDALLERGAVRSHDGWTVFS